MNRSSTEPRAERGVRNAGRPAHTVVLSDVHLSDFEPVDPRCPAWRRFKHAELSPDERLVALLDHVRALTGGAPVELVLDGDIFDFDTVIAVPEDPPFHVSWLERHRGLVPEEPRSAWKIRRILACHPAFLGALRERLAEGYSLVFIVGNHDLELHWPAVQAEIRAALAPADTTLAPAAITFCEFFYVAGGDTLVMHGNQLDAYCVCHDPLHPFIEVDGKLRVRSPFGNVAGKLMLNGMGLLNPHVEESFIRPLGEYLRFFFRYVARRQPLIGWTWFWTALVTLWVSIGEGLRPAAREPARLEERVEDVAARARSTPAVVRALRDVHVHPAVFSPLRVARELWLDRAALLLVLLLGGLQLGSMLHWITGAGVGWTIAIFLVLLPFYVAYARSCRSEVTNTEEHIAARTGELAAIAGVRRVVMGHTHRARAVMIGNVEYLNTGHWSPAYDDVECTRPVGLNGFAWIHPDHDARVAELRVFDGVGSRPMAVHGLSDEPPHMDTPRAPPGREAARVGA